MNANKNEQKDLEAQMKKMKVPSEASPETPITFWAKVQLF